MELCLYQTPYHGCVYGWRGWTMHLEENIPFVCEKLKKKKKACNNEGRIPYSIWTRRST